MIKTRLCNFNPQMNSMNVSGELVGNANSQAGGPAFQTASPWEGGGEHEGLTSRGRILSLQLRGVEGKDGKGKEGKGSVLGFLSKS